MSLSQSLKMGGCNGLFLKVVTQGDRCKILIVECSPGKLGNSSNTAWKTSWKNISLTWNYYLSLQDHDEWKDGFQFEWPGKFHLKKVRALENSSSQTYPKEFYSF